MFVVNLWIFVKIRIPFNSLDSIQSLKIKLNIKLIFPDINYSNLGLLNNLIRLHKYKKMDQSKNHNFLSKRLKQKIIHFRKNLNPQEKLAYQIIIIFNQSNFHKKEQILTFLANCNQRRLRDNKKKKLTRQKISQIRRVTKQILEQRINIGTHKQKYYIRMKTQQITIKTKFKVIGELNHNEIDKKTNNKVISGPTKSEKIIQVDIKYWKRIQQLLTNMSRSISDIKSAEEYIVSQRLAEEKKIFSIIKDGKVKDSIKMHLALTRITIYLYVHLMINSMDVKITLSLIEKLSNSHLHIGSLLLNGKEKKTVESINYISRNNQYVQKTLDFILSKKRIPQRDLFKNMLETSIKIQSINFLGVIDKTLKWEILKMPSYPFLPPSHRSHSLILDLDETLIHFNAQSQTFHVRPFAEDFIEQVSKYYQISIFTAATKDYADEIINEIDKNNNISYRLYRNHLTFKQQIPVKDISLLGRSLQSTIIVDNLPANFKTHPENGIHIKSWYGDDEDDILHKLCVLLIKIVQKYREDVRVGIRQYQEYIIDQISKSQLIYELKTSL